MGLFGSSEPPLSIENADAEYQETGTPVSGYAEQGPYHCGDCIHSEKGICLHPVVVSDPALKEKKKGRGIGIDPERGCCRFVNPG